MSKIIWLVLLVAVSVSPALAQEPHNIVVDGVRFELIAARNIHIVQDSGEAAFPPEVPHTDVLFYNETPATGSLFEGLGGIRVYRTADFVGYPQHESLFHDLQLVLDKGDDLTDYYMPDASLPFLPMLAAGQVLRSRAKYVETDSFRGISYLTVYQEVAEPLLRHDGKLLYTFQGISTDGGYYISVIFPVSSDIFPVELDADFDYEFFVSKLPEYLAKHTAWLNEAEADSFSPSLDVLDSQIASLSLE